MNCIEYLFPPYTDMRNKDPGIYLGKYYHQHHSTLLIVNYDTTEPNYIKRKLKISEDKELGIY